MLKFFNTLTRKKENFKPIRKDWVGLYTCGPTVYNYVHIGNFRTYLFQDILKRVLLYGGFNVKHIMNTTDVDDKTIRGAKEAGKTLKKFTSFYERAFLNDLKLLNIKPPSRLVRATDHIPDMIKFIQKLLLKGIAYQKNNSIYFSLNKFKPYGKLSHLSKRKLKPGARVDVDEYSKENVQDFVLWKGKKSGEPSWPAPFGEGRPGWHIECSAMSIKYLGLPFDLHSGGVDLIFPHHENEIAQAEAAYRKKFAKLWIHGEHLLVEGEKMAKSLGNIYTLRDIMIKKIDPLAFRYLLLSSHYRSKLNFTWESLVAAQSSLTRLYEFLRKLKIAGRSRGKLPVKYGNSFKQAIFDDLNTPRALAIIWQLISDYNKHSQIYNSKEILNLLYKFDQVLGLKFREVKTEKIPAKILKLSQQRENFRKGKHWQEADQIRKKIEKLGYLIDDTSHGPKVRSAN